MMGIQEAEARLYDATFLIGSMRRRAAVKRLSLSSAAKTAALLVKAVDKGHPNAGYIKEVLKSASYQTWTDRMWHIWASSRQEHAPPFFLRFILKAGLVKDLPVNRKIVAEGLSLLTDKDAQIQRNAEQLISGLPHEQTVNDLILDEWIRTESPFLEKIILEQKRLPSHPAKEALLFLVTGKAKAYNELKDEEGQYLIEAIAMAAPGMRTRINACVMESKDSQISYAYHKATMGSKDMDSEIALRALIASGNEDGLVKAAEDMTLAKLLDLCGHWEKTGRRPKEEKSRQTVENALSAYRKIGDIAVEPGQALPEGLQDMFEAWLAMPQKDKEIQNDLKAADPFIRARGLFLGSRKGLIDQETLRQKSKSPEWPERLIAALTSSDIQPGDDHCHWVRSSSGFLDEYLTTKVGRNIDEYKRCEETRDKLKKNRGFWAGHTLAHLAILQTFRGLFTEGAIVRQNVPGADIPPGTLIRKTIKKERQGD
jgi:hypothetical protein